MNALLRYIRLGKVACKETLKLADYLGEKLVIGMRKKTSKPADYLGEKFVI